MVRKEENDEKVEDVQLRFQLEIVIKKIKRLLRRVKKQQRVVGMAL